jgi:hypothetical protein
MTPIAAGIRPISRKRHKKSMRALRRKLSTKIRKGKGPEQKKESIKIFNNMMTSLSKAKNSENLKLDKTSISVFQSPSKNLSQEYPKILPIHAMSLVQLVLLSSFQLALLVGGKVKFLTESEDKKLGVNTVQEKVLRTNA